MNNWVDERSWMISVYICYILGFIILSVAGFNYILSVIGNTTAFMKVVLFVCVCLFVAMIVTLVYAAFITPFSELLKRFLDSFFIRNAKMVIPQDSEEAEEAGDKIDANIENNLDTADSDESKERGHISDNDISQREALKKEFMKDYVRYNCQDLPIYEIFESLFNQRQSGAFAARAFKCAMGEPFIWLSCFPGYQDAKRLFPQPGAIKGGKSNYSNANNKRNYSDDTIEETVSVLRDKLEELTVTLGKQES